MGRMMPLKWIEQAEARKMYVIAVSEALPALISPIAVTFLRRPLSRLRIWFSRAERDRSADTPSLDRVVRLRRARRVAG